MIYVCFGFGFLGERLEPEQVDALFKDCMGEENDDGEIQYAREYMFCFSYKYRVL